MPVRQAPFYKHTLPRLMSRVVFLPAYKQHQCCFGRPSGWNRIELSILQLSQIAFVLACLRRVA
eukprot:3500484-Amphidinium_carterae.1